MTILISRYSSDGNNDSKWQGDYYEKILQAKENIPNKMMITLSKGMKNIVLLPAINVIKNKYIEE